MFTIIVNPTSGEKKALKILPDVKRLLDERKITYSLIKMVYPYRPEQFSSVPCGKNDTVCVLGGDGTVLDVMNMLPAREMRLIYVPCGTGNDFIKCVGLPPSPMEAFRLQLCGSIRFIDYAKANDEYFMNVFGSGFDVDVLRKLDMFKHRFTGLKAYLRAVFQSVKNYKPMEVEVSIDGGKFESKLLTMISAGNGQFIGGGMKVAPDANPYDGKFDVVEIKPVNKLLLLVLLPTFILGSHVKLKTVKTYRCSSLVLRAKDLFYQIDGEIRSADKVVLSLISNELQFSL